MIKHLNDNLPVVVTIRTSGRDCYTDDIIEVCILPLTRGFDPHKTKLPFLCYLKPRRHGVDYQYVKKIDYVNCINKGADPYDVVDNLINWFERVRIKYGKKLMPICYDWPHIRSFLVDWLTQEEFDTIFDHQYRDLLSMATLTNDRRVWNLREHVYPKTKLTYLASQTKTKLENPRDIKLQALAIAQIYQHMLEVI